jgi:putative ABC transport system permease protein
MRTLLTTFSWPELRAHPWRHAAAIIAVMLGVALALSVHLINASALDEFSHAVRAVDGRPDLSMRAAQRDFDDHAIDIALQNPQVTLASPVLEVRSVMQMAGTAQGVAVRVLGVDAVSAPLVARALAMRPAAGADRLAIFAPDTVFANAAALQALHAPPKGTEARSTGSVSVQEPPFDIALQSELSSRPVHIAGSVAAGGGPLLVMDIAAAQDFFSLDGRISRLDLRLEPGADAAAVAAALTARPDWPAGVTATTQADTDTQVDRLSRAYRVNLTVLALVALFTGGFLVFSVLALGVAQRTPQFALLGVLGLTPRQRGALVLAEAGLLGVVGSIAGVLLGTGLAALALRVLGGDLGGGYFGAGARPALHFSPVAAVICGALGVAAALVGGWWPARTAMQLPPAQALKGLGLAGPGGSSATLARWPLLMMTAGVALAFAPPVAGLPIAAYFSVALLLCGGITALPWLVALLLDRLQPLLSKRLLPLLAVERARRMRGVAAVAVGGVVAALALAVALTVMVASFRSSMLHWLDAVVPAALYVRTGEGRSAGDMAAFTPALAQAVARVPGVDRLETLRSRELQLAPDLPAVTLLARPVHASTSGGAGTNLPLLDAPLAVPPGHVGIYVSEAVAQLYHVKPGEAFPQFSASFRSLAQSGKSQSALFFIAGVWRDYARQFGAVVIDSADYVRLTGDDRANDLALWLKPSAREADVQSAVRAVVKKEGADANLLQFTSAGTVRATSLRIFDRSFAVTYWLQAVAIGIGLFGVAASFGAQVLARRKEFGLMAHLGLTRSQILTVVAAEGATWTALGAAAGLALGLAVAVVLVKVVNPQSFHWTMELELPALRLALLAAAVVAAGTITARIAGAAAAGRNAVLAVREDW